MNQLMDLRPHPTAVVTGDDDRAMFILKYCRENNIDVPHDFSVLGYPNYAESALTTPPDQDQTHIRPARQCHCCADQYLINKRR